MNGAKLRRSRDVPEPLGSKIKNRFRVSYLAMFLHGLWFQSQADELVHQAADPIAKSQLTGRSHCRHPLYISSGEHRTASPIRGKSAE